MKHFIATLIFLTGFLSLLPAQSWRELTQSNSALPSNAIQSIFFDGDQSVWLCTQDSGLVHYQNGQFITYNSNSNDNFTADWANQIVKSPSGTYWIISEYDGLFKLKDGQFTQYKDDGNGHNLEYLRSVTLQNGGPENGGALWIGTWGHGLYKFDGTHWSYFDQASGILPDNSCLALACEEDPNSDSSVVWVGTNSGLMKYDGQNWEKISVENMDDLWVNAIAVKNGGPTFGNGQLIIGCETGELAFFDGNSWNIFNMADPWNPNNAVTDISVDADGIVWFGQEDEGLGMYDEKSLLSFYKDNSGILANDVISLATRSNNDSTEVWCSVYGKGGEGYMGISIYTQARVTGLSRQETMPGTFSLRQNYPNPFNPSTRIQFTMARTEHVNLTVFNALGQKVRTLVNRKLTPGSYTATFNAGSLPSGIYFYTLQTQHKSQTRKMLLVK